MDNYVYYKIENNWKIEYVFVKLYFENFIKILFKEIYKFNGYIYNE